MGGYEPTRKADPDSENVFNNANPLVRIDIERLTIDHVLDHIEASFPLLHFRYGLMRDIEPFAKVARREIGVQTLLLEPRTKRSPFPRK